MGDVIRLPVRHKQLQQHEEMACVAKKSLQCVHITIIFFCLYFICGWALLIWMSATVGEFWFLSLTYWFLTISLPIIRSESLADQLETQ